MISDLRILVHVYLMFVVYRTKVLKYNLIYLCVCVCVCVCCVFLAVLYSCCIAMHIFFHIIFVGSNHLMN